MASIGYMLRKEREKRKISLEQISEETKIGTKYLKALETDDYTIFPGETYIIGFMRNYARAIGLDPVDIIRQYKSIKMETVEEDEYNEETPIVTVEQPFIKNAKADKKIRESKEKINDIDVIELDDEFEMQPKKNRRKKMTAETKDNENFSPKPIEEKKSISALHLVIGGSGILILIGLFFLIKFIVVSLSSVEKKEIVSNLEEIKRLEFSNDSLQYDFSVNEYYKIKLGNKEHTVMFEKLSAPVEVNAADNNTAPTEFAFHLDDVIIQIKIKEKKDFDLDLDGKKDLSVNINSFNKDIVTATIKKLHSFIIVSNNNNETSAMTTTNNAVTNMKKSKTDVKNENTSSVKKGKIIFNAVVREKTYIKAFLDGKEQEGVIYYPKQKIHMEAHDVMQLKIGNAGGIVAVINGKKTRLGKRGEIANKIIKWEKDPYDESAYNLIIKDWQ